MLYDPPTQVTLATPSLDSTGLQLALRGGPPYPNVMYQRVLTDTPLASQAQAFQLDTQFLYRPRTTPNNQGGLSRVQAIEFAMTTWRAEADGQFRVYDWEVQFLNVGAPADQAPVWRLWTGLPEDGGQGWVSTEIAATLTSEQWHHLTLQSTILPDPGVRGGFGTHYVGFVIDGVTYPLDRTFAPHFKEWQAEQVATVHVQMEGSQAISTTGGYEVVLDATQLSYFPQDPWIPTCPTTPGEAGTLFGGAAESWQRVPGYSNGWKYNDAAQPPEIVPPIRNGRIPAGMKADWWDGQTTHRDVSGPAALPYGRIATLWCFFWPDVDAGNPFSPYIQRLWDRGVLDGYTATTFAPFGEADRATLARWIVRAQGWAFDLNGAPHFTDVPEADPRYPYIETAYHHGVLSGYADGTFRPDNPVTRGQMSKMIVTVLGWPVTTTGGPHFRDVDAANPFYGSIETLYTHGLISGYACSGRVDPCPGIYFRWGANNTRGQLTKVLANALESRFREVRRRMLRTTGQAGATVRQLQRRGAWELSAGAGSEAAQVAAFANVAVGEWEQERTRMRQHQTRFRLHTRNTQRAGQQLERLRQAWCALPADATG